MSEPILTLTCDQFDTLVSVIKNIPFDLPVHACNWLTSNKGLVLNKDQISGLLKFVFSTPSVIAATKLNYSALMSVLADLDINSFYDTLERYVKTNYKDNKSLNKLVTEKESQVKGILSALQSSDKAVKPTSSEESCPPIFNVTQINYLYLGCIGLSLLIAFIWIFVKRKEALSYRLSVLFGMICLGVLVGVIVMKVNPKCLFKNCYRSSGDITKMTGSYSGSLEMLNVSVNADITLDGESGGVITNVGCKGNSIPKDLNGNLVSNHCNNNGKFTYGAKSMPGYVLVGSCIDSLYSIKSSGSQMIKGLWLGVDNGTPYLTVSLDIDGITYSPTVTLSKKG